MGRIATTPNNVFLKKIKIRKRNQRERERKKGGRREFFEMIYWKKKRRECSSVFFHFISHRVAGCRQIWGCLSKFSSTFVIYIFVLFHFLLFFICVWVLLQRNFSLRVLTFYADDDGRTGTRAIEQQWHFWFVCEWSTDHTHHLLGEGETTTTTTVTQECQCQFQQFT